MVNEDMDPPSAATMAGQRVVVTGANGQLGGYLMRALADAGATPIGFGHHQRMAGVPPTDITHFPAVAGAIRNIHPDLIIHAAALTDVDECERNPDLADRVNHIGARNVAKAAAVSGAYLVAVSTDFVFSGSTAPYGEGARPDPISAYGVSKRAGEVSVLDASDGFAVVRTAWLYGGAGKHFPRTILNLLASRQSIDVVEDERGNPTFAGDLANALVQVAARRLSGILHLTNEGTASRYQLAQQVATLAGLSAERVRPTTVEAFLRQYPLLARRPADSSLKNERAAAGGVTLRPWSEALATYIPHLVNEARTGGA